MTSRIDSKPPSSMTTRSQPKAMPPCGGAPNWKASRRKPNFSWASCVGQAHDPEDPLLHVAPVDTDRAAADLVAVADHVVGVGERRPRVGVEGVEELGLRRGERVVDGRPRTSAHRDVTGRDGIRRRLEQRRVDDPEEAPRRLVDEAAAPADLQARGAEERAGRLGGAGGEEHAVARLGPDVCGEAGQLGLREVLGHRPGEGAVLLDEHVGEAAGAALPGPVLPGVELLARLARAAGHDDGPDVVGLEDAERGVGEVVGALDELEPEAQVGLVGAEAAHRLGVGQLEERGLQVDPDERPDLADDGLAELEDVGLLDEAHLDVELGELGLAVGAEVLVAVAAGDLVVALHAGDHEQLLEQLRALRQGVPAPGGEAGRARGSRGRPPAWTG